jgi:hypothetical protein
MFKVLLLFPIFISAEKRIGSVMVSALVLSAVDCGFGPRSGQTKDCTFVIRIMCPSESDISTRGLLFQ